MDKSSPLTAAVAKQDLDGLRRVLAKRVPVPARAVVDAARLGWTPGLRLLHAHGGDLNASHKHYRALHALIQEKPHEGGSSTPKRVACLEWLLAHGADPEQMGAWPAARALVIAAFTGELAYVSVLKNARPRDIFTAAALGDAKAVAADLAKAPLLATARDHGLLTALQCCGGSRLGKTSPRTAAGLVDCARRLLEAGADVHAKTPSWGQEVDVSYFVVNSGQIDMLKLCLTHGLDATAAIAPAAWNGREDVLDVLLAHGARLHEACDRARPVLNELVRWGQFKQARLLLARGASPNLPDDRGWTAIHQAVSRGNVQMLQDLMAKGGDARRQDAAGYLPGDFARGPKRADLRRALGLDPRG